MGSSGDKINSSVPTKNMVKLLTTNVAAGVIGGMYMLSALLDDPSGSPVEQTELVAHRNAQVVQQPRRGFWIDSSGSEIARHPDGIAGPCQSLSSSNYPVQ